MLATLYDLLKGPESVQWSFQDNQAFGGRPIDLLKRDEIERVRDV